jgi:formylmethanofuran dehydrogenase subunit C
MSDEELTALRAEIAQTRVDLGHTVEELADRVDVKARAKETIDEVKARGALAVEDAKTRTKAWGYELRTRPVATTRAVGSRVGTSMRANPRAWAITAGIVAAFALLVARRKIRENGS